MHASLSDRKLVFDTQYRRFFFVDVHPEISERFRMTFESCFQEAQPSWPGDTRQVALYLREFETAREFLLRGGQANWDSTPSPDIRVAAKLCGSRGSLRYHGHGDVANRDGTRFTFGLTAETPARGQHPSSIQGVWDGADRLELTSRSYVQGTNGATATASATARPTVSDRTEGIRFEMRRSTEEDFKAAC